MRGSRGKRIEEEYARLTAGHLDVNCAAHSDVGSAEIVFKYLGTTLMEAFRICI
jgi:hypothetical protein